MSLTRYTPHVLDSFRRVVARPALAAGLIVPGLALVVGGQALAGMAGLAPMGQGLSALAAAGMGYVWQRSLTEGEAMSPVQMVLRFVLWTLALNILQGFARAPQNQFAIVLGNMPNAELYTRTGVHDAVWYPTAPPVGTRWPKRDVNSRLNAKRDERETMSPA